MAKGKSQSTFTHPLKPSELHMSMDLARATHKSLMVWGAPGIGKSMLVAQYANTNFPLKSKNQELLEQMKAEAVDSDHPTTMNDVRRLMDNMVDQDTNLVDFRLSQVDPTDMRGIPVPVTYYVDVDGKMVPDHLVESANDVKRITETFWAPPSVLNLPEDWKGVIFMDEVNGAMPIVQAACYQLFLDRKLGELVIPKGAMIMAAGNRENDGGVTFGLATPLKDRMIHIELREDLDEWFTYAFRTLVDADVISYLKARCDDFNTLSPDNPNVCGGASPRSWVTVSDLKKEFRNRYGNGTQKQNRVLYAMIDGTIGDDMAARFKLHCEMTCKLPPVMDILNGKVKDTSGIQDMDISKHYAICSNLVTQMFAETRNKNDKMIDQDLYNTYSDNFLRFIDGNYGKNNQELAMMSIKTLFNQKIYFQAKHVPFYTEFAKKHADLIIASRIV